MRSFIVASVAWTRRVYQPASGAGVTSLFALYHGPGSSKTTTRRRGRLEDPALKHEPAFSQGWQHRQQGRGKTFRCEDEDQTRRPGGSRVSSELRKLRLEDFPSEKAAGLKSALDSEVQEHELVFGIAPCLLALTQRRRKARKLFVKDGGASQRVSVLKVCQEARQRGVQIHRVSKRDLDRMSSGGVHQGVCLQASPLGYLTEDPSPRRGKVATMPLWLVLDRIQDPMNLGAILRSAYFLGVDRVASSLHHSCPLTPVVSKASSGVMEVFGVYGYENLEDMVKRKVAEGWKVVGTMGAEAHQSQIPVSRCSDLQMSRPTLLLIGNEGEGLSRPLLSLCQSLVTIPAGRELVPGVESLNASVATAILLHSLLSRSSTR